MFMNQKAGVQNVTLGTTAAALYTAPANTVARLSSFTFTNQDTAARTLSVHLVKAGSAPSNANRVVAPYVIATNEAWTCPHLNHNLNPGDALYALADAAGVVSVYGSVIEMSKA